MRLSNLRIELKSSEFGEEAALIADVESEKFGKTVIWISVPKEYESWLTTDRYDGFLVALLFCAMKNNEDIFVDGSVSKKLLRNLNNYVQSVLKSFTFYLNKINISAKETTNKIIASATHIGTGFSGGVDSFCTVYEKFACENDPEYKIDTLVSFNIGHYGRTDGANQQQLQIFRDNFLFLSQYAQEVNLPYTSVNSNFGYYIEENEFWRELRQFGAPFIAAAILSLQNRFSKYYVSSNYSYLEMLQYVCKDKPMKKMKNRMINGDYMENIFYPLLNTENLEIIVDGSQYKRTEKTERITEYPPSYKYLEVSTRTINKKNTLKHWKTARTLWALEISDKLDLYSDSFDLDQWKRKDTFLYKCELIFSDPSRGHAKDNIDFAKAKGKKIPPYFVAFFIFYFYKNPLDFAIETIKAILRRILSKKQIEKFKMKLQQNNCFEF
jgi:hypothetical protein